VIVGFDVSGVVTQAGAAVEHIAVGDEVYGLLDYRRDGACAEFTRARGAFLKKKPPSLSHTEAACVPLAALTALQALLLKAKLKAGERLLVVGASGGVGHFAVQIAKARGAHVTAVCSAKNADFVTGLGADEVIAYDRGDIPAEARFDVVFETVGSRNFAALKPFLTRRGRFVSTLPDVPALIKSRLLAPLGLSRRCEAVIVHPDPHGLDRLTELIEAGKLKPHIQHVYELDQLAEAHRVSEAGHVAGKLAVRVLPD
jgi:NADPH:quinone reductase-like Zn-dependent oxidoreductase